MFSIEFYIEGEVEVEAVKPKRSWVDEALERKYEGKELVGFDVALEKVVDAKDAIEAAKILQPLLRQNLVLVDPRKAEVVEIAEERGEKVIRILMPNCEVKIKRHYVEIMPPSVYLEMG